MPSDCSLYKLEFSYLGVNIPAKIRKVRNDTRNIFPWLCISLVSCVISPDNHCTIVGPSSAGHGDTYKLNTRALHICSDMGDRIWIMEKC